MLLKIKFTAFAAIIIASGATETTQTVVESLSETTELENIGAAADSTHRDLYGSAEELNRNTDCPNGNYCETRQQCENSQAADLHGFNGVITNNNCMGGCVFKEGGKVSWSTTRDFDVFNNCAPRRFSRVCCDDETDSPTESPTTSPTWLDDSWGGDKWDGGSKNSWNGGSNKWGWSGGSNKWGWSGGSSSNNNSWNGGSNKWGWSGGNLWSNNNAGWSSKNDDWGGYEPSMKQWNHDGWHQDGWQDDGWKDDGFKKNNQWGGDMNNDPRFCDLSDCCEAKWLGTSFSLYNRFLNTERFSDGRWECRTRVIDGGTGDWEKCNLRGFCYSTDEGCAPSDCR